MLEAAQYESNAFVTLTYDDSKLPMSSRELPTLAPEHLRNFLKRLRKSVAPVRIRFYAVGEYGDESWRPHYHAALFNFPTCVRGRTLRRPESKNRALWSDCCVSCRLVGETWGKGDVDLGILEAASAQYVSGYVTKKMTRRDDFRLLGREPEFARMSNRPGIAFSALWEIADQILKYDLDKSLPQGDVPVTLRHGSRELPLGRYLRRKLRLLIGKEENTPAEALAIIEAEMSLMREAQFARKGRVSLKQTVLEASKGELARFHSRNNLYNKGNRHL